FKCDWSSDVCSSDLPAVFRGGGDEVRGDRARVKRFRTLRAERAERLRKLGPFDALAEDRGLSAGEKGALDGAHAPVTRFILTADGGGHVRFERESVAGEALGRLDELTPRALAEVLMQPREPAHLTGHTGELAALRIRQRPALVRALVDHGGRRLAKVEGRHAAILGAVGERNATAAQA